MGRPKKAAAAETDQQPDLQPGVSVKEGRLQLAELVTKDQALRPFEIWVEGTTPLICHAWSLKAKLSMLNKQTKETKDAQEKRNPEQDFQDSLYQIDKGVYGFPVTAIKAALLANAHVKKGVAKTDAMAGIWLDAEIVHTRPALKGARCDMPLVRIHGSPPEMREDMVRIGAGPRKTANLAYRAQFSYWAIHLTGLFNPEVLPANQVMFLLSRGGASTGIGDWRNEKKGWFGAFRVCNVQQQAEWESFVAGKGKMPKRTSTIEPPKDGDKVVKLRPAKASKKAAA